MTSVDLILPHQIVLMIGWANFDGVVSVDLVPKESLDIISLLCFAYRDSTADGVVDGLVYTTETCALLGTAFPAKQKIALWPRWRNKHDGGALGRPLPSRFLSRSFGAGLENITKTE